eukprot:403350799
MSERSKGGSLANSFFIKQSLTSRGKTSKLRNTSKDYKADITQEEDQVAKRPRINAPSYYVGHLNDSLIKKEFMETSKSSHHFKGLVKGIRRYKKQQEELKDSFQEEGIYIKQEIVKDPKKSKKYRLLNQRRRQILLQQNGQTQEIPNDLDDVQYLNRDTLDIQVIQFAESQLDEVNLSHDQKLVKAKQLRNSSNFTLQRNSNIGNLNGSQMIRDQSFSQNIQLSTPKYSISNYQPGNSGRNLTEQQSKRVSTQISHIQNPNGYNNIPQQVYVEKHNLNLNDQVNIEAISPLYNYQTYEKKGQENFHHGYQKQGLVSMLINMKSYEFQKKADLINKNAKLPINLRNEQNQIDRVQSERINKLSHRHMSPLSERENYLSPVTSSHDICEKTKLKQYDNTFQKLKEELLKSKASQLIDIVSPKVSQQANRLYKLRQKTKKIIETRHNIDHQALMRGFSIQNPAKKLDIREVKLQDQEQIEVNNVLTL